MNTELSKEMRELIEEILDEFDFEIVHRTMKASNGLGMARSSRQALVTCDAWQGDYCRN